MSPLSRQVFSTQDEARQKLKICPDSTRNKLSESDFKNSVHGNGKRLSTQFLENDEIFFHLAVMSQCEQGGEGQIWDSAYAD